MGVDIPYSPNPYQPPEADVLELPLDLGALDPVPWEDFAAFPGFWKRLGGMFSLLFSRPFELVDRIPVTESLGSAWRFNILMTLPYLAFMALMMVFMGAVVAFTPKDPNMPKGLMAGVFGGEFILITAFMLLGMFIYGAIFHAMLWMWGGTREGRGLGQTIRACGYIWGFANLGMLLPCINLFVMIGGLIFLAMSLARIHRTDTWRAICALFTPLFLCCFGYALIFAFAIGMSAFKH